MKKQLMIQQYTELKEQYAKYIQNALSQNTNNN